LDEACATGYRDWERLRQSAELADLRRQAGFEELVSRFQQ
jgi:hypothetical protein